MLDLSVLPRIEDATARIHDALLSLPADRSISVGGLVLTVAWHLPRVLSDTAVTFACDTDVGVFSLTTERGLIDDLSDVLLFGWRDESPEALPLEWRVTCAVAALLSAPSLGAGTVRVRLDPTGQQATAPAPACALGGTVGLPGRTYGIRLNSASGEPRAVEELCGAVARPAALASTLRFPVRCLLARLMLDLERLRSLASGDVLLLPKADGSILPAHLLLPDGIRWAGRVCEDGTFEVIAKEEREETLMDMAEMTIAAADDELADEAAAMDTETGERLADLPVALELQFHRLSLPLAQFSTLAEGRFLDLGIDLSQPIQIKANDQTVGSGRLVQIGNRVGVRIERWRFKNTAPSP
jgi:type III secretion system YscQ/HrcQ family protein